MDDKQLEIIAAGVTNLVDISQRKEKDDVISEIFKELKIQGERIVKLSVSVEEIKGINSRLEVVEKQHVTWQSMISGIVITGGIFVALKDYIIDWIKK